PTLRPRLQRLIERRGPEHLHRILTRVDPATARHYAPKDWSRVTRALEVYFSSGTPLSVWQARTPEEPTAEAARLHYLVLNPPRDELYARINERADLMAERGLVEEERSLIASGTSSHAQVYSANRNHGALE